MKARELRIGNYVKSVDSKDAVIIQRVSDYYVTIHEDDEYVERPVASGHITPIPLTEEWLLKFGFEKDGERIFKKGNCMWWIKGGYWGDGAILQLAMGLAPLINCPCDYVHQFQNLYFALIGKEIELNDLEK